MAGEPGGHTVARAAQSEQAVEALKEYVPRWHCSGGRRQARRPT